MATRGATGGDLATSRPGFGRAVRRLTTETKQAFKTTEFCAELPRGEWGGEAVSGDLNTGDGSANRPTLVARGLTATLTRPALPQQPSKAQVDFQRRVVAQPLVPPRMVVEG
jgi:hypothetical protein